MANYNVEIKQYELKCNLKSEFKRAYDYLRDIIECVDMPDQEERQIVINTLDTLICNIVNDSEQKQRLLKKRIKHLQIGDTFYNVVGLCITKHQVEAIAIQPDNSIVYNWKYRSDSIHTNITDASNEIQSNMDAMIKALEE